MLAIIAGLLVWRLNDGLAGIFVPDPFTPWTDGPASRAVRSLAVVNATAQVVLLAAAIWIGTRGKAVSLAALIAIVTGMILFGAAWFAKGIDTQDVVARLEGAAMAGSLVSSLVAALPLVTPQRDRSAAPNARAS